MLKLSQAADEDLLNIYVEGITQFGLAQAQAYHEGLKRALDTIERYPAAARERLELRPPMRVHRYRSHVIMYIAEGEDVIIVRIRHGREDWDSQT